MDTAQTASSLEELLSFEPDLGAPSGEQPLRFMIYSYYRKHFYAEEASELTDRYISALAAFQACEASGPSSNSTPHKESGI